MKVKTLIEALSEYPEDYNVDLAKVFAVASEDGDAADPYIVSLDFPIIGTAASDQDKDVKLVVDKCEGIEKFGKLEKFEG